MRPLHSFMFLAVVLIGAKVFGQVPVPFVTAEDRFMVFANRRFEKMEPRPPQAVFPMNDQIAYQDHAGRLKLFVPEGRRLVELDAGPIGEIHATRNRIAWRTRDTLKTVRDGRTVVLADHVGRFTVSDSMVVYHDTLAGQLFGLWKGRSTVLADIASASERPQWTQGSNAALFLSRETRELFLFQYGSLRKLCDSTDVGIVSAGGDLVGYWDDKTDRFMAKALGETHFLSDLRPASVQTGDGILAYVDGNGRLKCFAEGAVHTVLETTPSGWWVKDSLLLYLDEGLFKLFRPDGSITVERYVPERWQVEGALLVYLDINRELKGIRSGERIRFGTEAAIPTFDLFGDAVIYPSPTGLKTVIRNGRSYSF